MLKLLYISHNYRLMCIEKSQPTQVGYDHSLFITFHNAIGMLLDVCTFINITHVNGIFTSN